MNLRYTLALHIYGFCVVLLFYQSDHGQPMTSLTSWLCGQFLKNSIFFWYQWPVFYNPRPVLHEQWPVWPEQWLVHHDHIRYFLEYFISVLVLHDQWPVSCTPRQFFNYLWPVTSLKKVMTRTGPQDPESKVSICFCIFLSLLAYKSKLIWREKFIFIH